MTRTSTIDERIVYGIVTVAVALSYSTLAGLAERAGYSAVMAWAWPIAVEGLAIMAARAATRLHTGRRYAQSLLVATTAISVAAGAASRLLPPGPLPGWAGAAVAVIPTLCVLVAPHLAVQMRRDAAATSAGGAVAVADATQDGAGADATHDDATLIDGHDTGTPALTLVVAPELAPSHDASDQERHAATPDGATLFDVEAPAIDATPMSREEKLNTARHLLATTKLSLRDIADRVGLSKDAVHRLVGPGGRAALVAAAG